MLKCRLNKARCFMQDYLATDAGNTLYWYIFDHEISKIIFMVCIVILCKKSFDDILDIFYKFRWISVRRGIVFLCVGLSNHYHFCLETYFNLNVYYWIIIIYIYLYCIKFL